MVVLLDDVLRTTVNATLFDGTLYQNIFHHKRIGASGISDQAHLDAIEDWVETVYATIDDEVESQVVSALSTVDIVAWTGAEWAIESNLGTFTWAFVPTQVGSNMPNQVSPYVIFKTTRPKTVGRKFLFPLVEASYATGVLTGPALATIVAWAAAALVDVFLGPIDDLELGVVRTGVNEWQVFTAAVVSNVVGTQRRRRLGVGA